MKQSTFSAFVANSIKNLLQGYTKGIRFVAVLMVLLTMGIGQAWGATYPLTVNYPYVYLDNSTLGWDGCNVVVGHDTYSYGYLMTQIPNTKLFYKEIEANWTDAKGIVFIKATSQWGEWKDNSLWNRTNGQTRTGYQWDNQYESMDYHKTYLCTSTGNDDLTISYKSNGYSALNYTQTIKTAVNGADANSKASISITSYKMTGNGTVTKQTASIGTSAKSTTISAAHTATTTLSVSGIVEGYEFDGWYTAATGGTLLSNETTYTYYPTAAKTVYARFTLKTYTIKWVVNGVEKNTETVAHGSNVANAPTIDPNNLPCGDVFAGWTTEFYAGKSAPATLYKTEAEIPPVTGDVTYYAVFADYE